MGEEEGAGAETGGVAEEGAVEDASLVAEAAAGAEEEDEAVEADAAAGEEEGAVEEAEEDGTSKEGMNDLAVGLRLRGFLGRLVEAAAVGSAVRGPAGEPKEGTNGLAATFSVVDGADMVRRWKVRNGTTQSAVAL